MNIISASLVSADVSEGAGGAALAGGADVELAHSGPALVHPGERERLGAHLLGQRHLHNVRSQPRVDKSTIQKSESGLRGFSIMTD